MRWIVAIVSLMFGVGWVACELESTAGPIAHVSIISPWRRTVDGWERLVPPDTAPDPESNALLESHPHPIVLSLLEGMLSVLLLVAFSPSEDPSESREALEQPKGAGSETGTA